MHSRELFYVETYTCGSSLEEVVLLLQKQQQLNHVHLQDIRPGQSTMACLLFGRIFPASFHTRWSGRESIGCHDEDRVFEAIF